MRIQNLTKINESEYEITSHDCPDCGVSGMTAVIDSAKLYGMNIGVLKVQDIFPDLSIGLRERFISGTCEPCFMKFTIW
jgi:hypothetical protein